MLHIVTTTKARRCHQPASELLVLLILEDHLLLLDIKNFCQHWYNNLNFSEVPEIQINLKRLNALF